MPISTPLKTPPTYGHLPYKQRKTQVFNLSFAYFLNIILTKKLSAPHTTPSRHSRTPSINRGRLKSFCSSFILIANAVLLGQTHRSAPYGNSAHPPIISTAWKISQNYFKDSSLCFEITATLQPTFISLQGQTHWPAPTDFTFPLSAFH